jgi:hypothetical protein
MSRLVNKLIEHILCEDTNDAMLMIHCTPVLLSMKDKDGIYLLYYAFAAQSPFRLTYLMVREWPVLLTTTMPLSKLVPLHNACLFNASAEVISFLLKEFPKAKYAKDKTGRTPLMCYLVNGGPRNLDVLESLSPCKMKFIGDSAANRGRKIDEGTINVNRAVWRLDNHDPSLRAIKMADDFFEMAGCEFFDVMDAIYGNPHIGTLYFIYRQPNLFLWEDGMCRDAFSYLLREKTLIKSITIKMAQMELTHFGDILQDCMHL